MSSPTFTIQQTPSVKFLYLYPVSNSSVSLTPYGSANNWDCVNDAYDIPDVDTFVYTTSVTTVRDVYNVEDSGLTSETIRAVNVYCVGKVADYSSSVATYKIVIGDGTGKIDRSSQCNLTTDYSVFVKEYSTNPFTGTAWTWANIDAMLIGVECSSPTITNTSMNMLLRPNSQGDWIGLRRWTNLIYDGVGNSTNYTYIYEETPDDTNTFLSLRESTSEGDDSDLWHIQDPTDTGIVDNLQYYYRMIKYNSGSRQCTPMLKQVSVATTYGTAFTPSTSWTNYMTQWNSSPSTGVAWRIDEIKDLQIGMNMDVTPVNIENILTQAYVLVNYHKDYNPQIRTTGCYERVEYIPSTSTYYLNKPNSYNFNNSRNISKINLWNGGRVTYDSNRNSKTLSMTGCEWNSTATTTLNNIMNVKDEGVEITISGFDDININTTWFIRDFNYTLADGGPIRYDWSLELEKA